MLQNATRLRKSAPWPPNISDEHVSCTAPATRHASFQILFKCPTPASAFEIATKPSRFAHFWQGAEIPCACHAKPHLNLQTWSEHVVFLEMCFAPTTACTFFDMSTSKSGPTLRCFVHFDLEMCFAPQRRALFSTCQLPKVVRHWCVLYILAWKCASHHKTAFNFSSLIWPGGSAPAALALAPTYRPSGGKNQWLFYLFALHLLSSDSFSSLIFFLLGLFPPLLFHLSILSEVWLLSFRR